MSNRGMYSQYGVAAPPFTKGPYVFTEQISFANASINGSAGTAYYVDRNISASGNGKSWGEAFKTINEAITKVNADYSNTIAPSNGRNRTIFIGEGWYAELPQTLTANDVTIICNAPGNHDSTVLYGVPVAGTFSGTAGGPALTIEGDNNTLYGLGLYTSDPLFASLQIGNNAAGGGAVTTTGTKVLNCSFVRDVDNGSLYGILDMGADGTLIDGCFFSTSCKDAGVYIYTNGVINPVNSIVSNCRFVGCPIGVSIASGSGSVEGCFFMSDYSDRPGTMATPVVIDAKGSSYNNVCGVTNKAGITTGGGTIVEAGCMGSDGLIGQT